MGEKHYFKEEIQKVALLLLQQGENIDFVSDATGLSKNKVLKLNHLLKRVKPRKKAG